MGNKNIIIIVVIIALLGAAYLLSTIGSGNSNSKNEKMLSIKGEIAKIKITKNKVSVTLYQEKDLWLVKEKSNYPADMKKVAKVVEQLRAIKGDLGYSNKPGKHSKYELEDPDKVEDSKGAIKIELLDSSDKLIDGIILGKTKRSKKQSDTPWAASKSTFARNINSDQVYLCNTSIEADNAPSNWLKKQFLDLKKNQFREITITKQGTTSVIANRTNPKSHFKLLNLDKTLKQTDHAVDNLARAAETLQMESVMTPEESKDLKFINSYTMKAFDGLVYTFELTDSIKEKNGQHCFKIVATIDETYLNDKTQVASDKKKNIQRLSPEAATKKAKEFNDTHSKWHYLLASWISKKYLKKISDLSEKIKKDIPKKPNTQAPIPKMPFMPRRAPSK